jgi:hypothetical protein
MFYGLGFSSCIFMTCGFFQWNVLAINIQGSMVILALIATFIAGRVEREYQQEEVEGLQEEVSRA